MWIGNASLVVHTLLTWSLAERDESELYPAKTGDIIGSYTS